MMTAKHVGSRGNALVQIRACWRASLFGLVLGHVCLVALALAIIHYHSLLCQDSRFGLAYLAHDHPNLY